MKIKAKEIGTRNELHYAVITSGLRSTCTPTKKERLRKAERKEKQKGYEY